MVGGSVTRVQALELSAQLAGGDRGGRTGRWNLGWSFAGGV